MQEIELSQILIKHKGSLPATSWRQDEIKLTSDEAYDIAEALREEIARGDKTFASCASQRSDDYTAIEGGACGKVWHGTLNEDIESSAFNLRVGELSKPVESPQGWHLLLRTK